jgi:hypothetical protein
MITTTATAIIEKIVTVIEALTPLEVATRPYRRSKAPNLPLATWATDAGAMGLLRLFEVERSGPREDPGINDPQATLAAVPIDVTMVYPPVPRLYGLADEHALRAVVESDAHQIRDALFAPTALVPGHQANMVTIEGLAQGERMWFQTISLTAIFYIVQRR